MATIYFKTHHISKGETIAASLKDRLNYGKNSDKTEDGELITSYMCDPATVDAEFLLAKAQYKAITGREQRRDRDVLCYQIRQAFPHGEVTPEQANRIGYDFALRWTKGKHAFLVATHTDRQHIHTHIYYNSTNLDCTGKFRDYLGSARAVRRLSDRICLENNLSIIKNPKLHSKGQYKHYGEWAEATGQPGADRPQSFKARLKATIDAVLSECPNDFAAFLAGMEAAGYEVRHGRGGAVSFRAEGASAGHALALGPAGPSQRRFTRLRASTLGEGYGQEDILAILASRAPFPAGRSQSAGRKPSAGSSGGLRPQCQSDH